MCEYKFRTFSELELHIKDKHVNFQAKCCDQCGKTFVTAWRLRKHMRIHSQIFTRTCKYFKSNTICPFEELGCKFNHDYVHMKGTVDVKDDTTKDNVSDSSPSLNNSSLEKNGNTTSFHTSTPKSINCDECKDWSECVDCIVRHTLGRHGARMLNF